MMSFVGEVYAVKVYKCNTCDRIFQTQWSMWAVYDNDNDEKLEILFNLEEGVICL